MPDAAPTDLDIGRAADLLAIEDVAASAGIAAEHLEPYGRYVAKVAPTALAPLADRPLAKYVVVTAVTPTPLGEGKTTTSIGLAQALAHLGHRSMLSLRQPSLGPTFGIKGGAAGAGYSQVVPMQSINLHLTGDFHAVTAAHNLLTAMLDNHLHHGNDLGIDARTITWRRVLDVNDRSLRNVVVGLGDRMDGVPRQAGFDITAASEVMVILSLATSLHDLRARLGRIVVGFTHDGTPVTAEDLRAAGEHAGPAARRAVRQHRDRQLLGRRRSAGHPGSGLPHHRSRLRRRHGGRAVLRRQVPDVGPASGRRGRRRDGARAEDPLGAAPGRGRSPAATRDARRAP